MVARDIRPICIAEQDGFKNLLKYIESGDLSNQDSKYSVSKFV